DGAPPAETGLDLANRQRALRPVRRRRIRLRRCLLGQQRFQLVDGRDDRRVDVDHVAARLRASPDAEYQASMVGGETHHVQPIHGVYDSEMATGGPGPARGPGPTAKPTTPAPLRRWSGRPGRAAPPTHHPCRRRGRPRTTPGTRDGTAWWPRREPPPKGRRPE